MKPDREGIWEWFEEDGTRRLVAVCNCGVPNGIPYLRVAWWGGYYNVNDEFVGAGELSHKAEWPDRWGKYVAGFGELKQEDLYIAPTPEQRKEIMKRYENKS